jgi:hypothetical protein
MSPVAYTPVLAVAGMNRDREMAAIEELNETGENAISRSTKE